VAQHIVTPGATVLLLGTCGTGKTQIAVELARALFGSGVPGCGSFLYTTADQMQDFLRDASTDSRTSMRDAIARFAMPRILVLDEIDKRSPTDFGEKKLIRILDERYRALKTTIAIGNILPDALAKSLGPSASDRLRETGLLIECTWGSFRRQTK
jgi:DNA replication protein DnaC